MNSGLKRSGYLKRSVVRRTFATWREWAEANNQNFSKENIQAIAESFLDSWERYAFSVYKKHGLPTYYNCWRPDKTSAWKSEDDRPPGPPRPGDHFTKAFEIGAKSAEDDSDIGFASAILKRVYYTRARLKKIDNIDVWRAFVDSAQISQDVDALHLEYGLAEVLGPGRLQALGRAEGGRARATAQRDTIRARHARWRLENGKIAADISARARAKLIATKLKGTPFEASEATIRRVISKTGA